jgi:hypothetical protein
MEILVSVEFGLGLIELRDFKDEGLTGIVHTGELDLGAFTTKL